MYPGKKIFFAAGWLFATAPILFSQNIAEIIHTKEVERIENFLSADDMRGRKTFTPDIEKAAGFIAKEFTSIGLGTWKNSGSYLQEFTLVRPRLISQSALFDNEVIDPKNILIITCRQDLKIDHKSGYEVVVINAGSNLRREAISLVQSGKNFLVIADESYSSDLPRLVSLKRSLFKTDKTIIFILSKAAPKKFHIEASHEISEQKLSNVMGVIPGKSLKDELVIFSAHYDHLGVGKPVNGDSIFNGANDNAAGTTAVIMLAKYFQTLSNNERTIIFTAFTAEEIGGLGSQYFSKQVDPSNVMAMFNIEMIGTESKWGMNSAFITGYEKTDMGKILQKNLEGTEFLFYPDPYPEQNLFYRSDNATLARLGVPAHTISTAKMDEEPHYHKVTDESATLNMENMTMIIRAIALSSKTIIQGTETPLRVKVDELR